jgi:hypothetical protein
MPLRQLAPDLWVADFPSHTYLGLHLGSRMTVVRLLGGGLLLHSPVDIDAALKAEIEALGTVTHVVAPSLFHHMYAGHALAAFPDAELHGPEPLHRKRKDLRFHHVLSETPHRDWEGAIVPVSIDGCMLGETVLVHRPSKTVISSDLAENFQSSDHWYTRMYLKAAGLEGQIGWSRLLRVVYRDHVAARASLAKLLSHDFDRIVIAHGAVIETHGREAVDRTFHFLRG